MVTEGAYGQLKGRWRVLLRKNESDKEHVRTATPACMVLHNVCLLQGDSIPRKLDLSFGPDGKERRNRDEIRKLLLMRECKCASSFRRGHESQRCSLWKVMGRERNWESFLT